jgi:hypothetical protein
MFEEIGILPDEYMLKPFTQGALRTIEFSEPNNANTCYLHHFFRVEVNRDVNWNKLKLDECKWVDLSDLNAKSGTNICSHFPLDNLKRVLGGSLELVDHAQSWSPEFLGLAELVR